MAVGDFDLDGRDDLLVRDTSTGLASALSLASGGSPNLVTLNSARQLP